jgi:putative polyhydroxyalkanoate system protein
MPKISISRAHSLSIEDAKAKAEKICAQMQEKHGLEGKWASDTRYEFKRTGAKGVLEVGQGKVSVEVDLSMLLSALKSKVEQKLRDGLEEEFG